MKKYGSFIFMEKESFGQDEIFSNIAFKIDVQGRAVLAVYTFGVS